jgi:hypothetical protein
MVGNERETIEKPNTICSGKPQALRIAGVRNTKSKSTGRERREEECRREREGETHKRQGRKGTAERYHKNKNKTKKVA